MPTSKPECKPCCHDGKRLYSHRRASVRSGLSGVITCLGSGTCFAQSGSMASVLAQTASVKVVAFVTETAK